MSKPNRELREVVFYYKRYHQPRVVVETRQCKQPSRTKVWAELQDRLYDQGIERVGYDSNKI